MKLCLSEPRLGLNVELLHPALFECFASERGVPLGSSTSTEIVSDIADCTSRSTVEGAQGNLRLEPDRLTIMRTRGTRSVHLRRSVHFRQ
jgi:hypothetical protein